MKNRVCFIRKFRRRGGLSLQALWQMSMSLKALMVALMYKYVGCTYLQCINCNAIKSIHLALEGKKRIACFAFYLTAMLKTN
jgi:hypothetical protein